MVPTKKYATDMAGEAKDNVIFKFTTTTTS